MPRDLLDSGAECRGPRPPCRTPYPPFRPIPVRGQWPPGRLGHHPYPKGHLVSARIRHHTAPSPYGCRWCGEDRHQHGRSWVGSRGIHSWEQPTNAQIKARMHARRNTRKDAS